MSKDTLIALKDFIVLENPSKDKSLIHLPETADKLKSTKTADLVVRIVGDECKEVKEGDRLVVDRNAILAFTFKTQTLYLTREENVGAVIRYE